MKIDWALCLVLTAFTVTQISVINALTLSQLPASASTTSLGSNGEIAAGGTINDVGVTTVRRGTNLMVNQLIEAVHGVAAIIDTLQHFTRNTGRYLERLRISTESLGNGLLHVGTNVATTALDEFSNRLIDQRNPAISSSSSSSSSASSSSSGIANIGNRGSGNDESSNLLTFLATRQLSTDENGSTDNQIDDSARQLFSDEQSSIGDRTRELSSAEKRAVDDRFDDPKIAESNWRISLDDFWSTINSWANNMRPLLTDGDTNGNLVRSVLSDSLSAGTKSAEHLTKLASDTIQSLTNNLTTSLNAASSSSGTRNSIDNLTNALGESLSKGVQSIAQLGKQTSDSIQNGIDEQRKILSTAGGRSAGISPET